MLRHVGDGSFAVAAVLGRSRSYKDIVGAGLRLNFFRAEHIAVDPPQAMPSEVSQNDSDYEQQEDRNDKSGSKQKTSPSANSKCTCCYLCFQNGWCSDSHLAKDLSHVPCKFFKVGGCTAGPSCPFSHHVLEPGQHKEVCNWFIKGNCKFAHKCALAHILPGQSMAMDRKNKKAAQQAGAASGEKPKSSSKTKKEAGDGSGGAKPSLLAGGSTAPTRMLNPASGSAKSGRLPISMSLKATISPSAPAPALTDTDFASFTALDELDGAQNDSSPRSQIFDDHYRAETSTELSKHTPSTRAVPLPPSAPRSSTTSAVNDFGPIGSPPHYRPGMPTSPRRLNGFSPGASPRNPSHMASSPARNIPVTAPGTQDHFIPGSFQSRAGIAASLGSGMAMMGGRRGFSDAPPQVSSSVSNTGFHAGQRGEYGINVEYNEGKRPRPSAIDSAVEDDDLEEFLPSSLNDLLTPEERSRRMSRSNSGQQKSSLTDQMNTLNIKGADQPSQGSVMGQEGVALTPNGNGSGMGHRYSRSVPAHTLLGDIKSIWSDPSSTMLSSSPHRGPAYPSALGGGLGNAADEMGLSMSIGSAGGLGGTPSSLSMMSPSNASAAFLPGLHRHYLDSKAKQLQQNQPVHGGISRGMRGVSNPLMSTHNSGSTSNNSLANNYLQPLGGLGLPSSATGPSGLHTHIHGATATTYRTPSNPFDLTQTLHQSQAQTARAVPSNLSSQASALEDPLAPNLLSPGARALQAHNPGQSLPQGLAAGYSRIHALPPLPNVASPPTGGSYMTGASPGGPILGNNSEGPFGDWPTTQGSAGASNTSAGLDSMFSRMSYSAATNRGPGVPTAGPPPGLSRNMGIGRYQAPTGPLSPLHAPVVSKDDDIHDIFDMDK